MRRERDDAVTQLAKLKEDLDTARTDLRIVDNDRNALAARAQAVSDAAAGLREELGRRSASEAALVAERDQLVREVQAQTARAEALERELGRRNRDLSTLSGAPRVAGQDAGGRGANVAGAACARRRAAQRPLVGAPYGRSGPRAEPAQDRHQRAEPGEAALQQVGAHERGEPQPVRAVEERARLRAEGEGHEHERSGEDADQAFDGHGRAGSGSGEGCAAAAWRAGRSTAPGSRPASAASRRGCRRPARSRAR